LDGSDGNADAALAQSDEGEDGELCWLVNLNDVILARRWKHGESAGYTTIRVYQQTMESAVGLRVRDADSETLARMITDGYLHKLPSLPTALAAQLQDELASSQDPAQ